MHTGGNPGKATFWLLGARNSLVTQSHYEPDGTGIGVFDAAGNAAVMKQPLTAWKDRVFAEEAKALHSTTFLAHVRYASAGGVSLVNTHPFEQSNRIFAHNGILGGLEDLDARLRQLGTDGLVHGQTDSERMFALITAQIKQADGDIGQGIKAAVGWISQNLPVFSLNFILTTATDLWALRYPEVNELHVLDRRPDPRVTDEPLDAISRRIHAYSPHLTNRHVVIVSTEKMTEDPRWQALPAGHLLHVTEDLQLHMDAAFTSPPRHQIQQADLGGQEKTSQRPDSPA